MERLREKEREVEREICSREPLATHIPSRSIIRDASGFSDASWGKYSHCEITRFYTKSLYRGAIYHSFNARVIERSRSARDPTSFNRIRTGPPLKHASTRLRSHSERITCMCLKHTFADVFFMFADPTHTHTYILQSWKRPLRAPLCQFKQCYR